MSNTHTYMLAGITPELWLKVKLRAMRERQTVKSILLSLLTYYASKGMPK